MSLTSVIDHLFSQKEGAEGDLAVLSSYTHADRDSANIVTNAILARLYGAKSVSEIDLGFRLLADLGPESIEVVAQINRNARKVLDAVATRRGELLFSAIKAENPSGFDPFRGDSIKGNNINDQVCATVPLNEEYVSTVVERNVASWVYSGSVAPTSETDVNAPNVPMLIYEIDRSNIVFAELLDKYKATPIRIDLSETYLRESAVHAIALHSSQDHFVLNGAFIETSYGDPNQTKELQGRPAFFKAAVKIGVVSTRSDNPLLPTHVQGFPGYEFVGATTP